MRTLDRKIGLKSLFILYLFLSCNSSNIEVEQKLNEFSKKLDSIDFVQLKTITTEKGFNSIIKWSDSLKNKEFIKKLSNNLKNNGTGVFKLTDKDSLIYLSLGKSDVIVGATGGYLILRRNNKGIRIEEFRGGK